MKIKTKPMIKIKRSKNGQLYFVVLAKNNKVLLTSETYKSKQGVNKGIRALCDLYYCRGIFNVVDES